MESDDELLEECMAGLAAGDRAFVFTFHRHFGSRVEATVRHLLAELGRADITRDHDELGGMVLDACLLIADRAGGWRPGGATPWTWAHKALRSMVASSIGHRTIELDEGRDGEADHRGAMVADLTVARPCHDIEALMTRHPATRLLVEAIRAVGRPRDQDVYVEYRIQQGMGDPSPANTVAPMFALRPDNVRQIARRHGRKVWALIADDPRYVSLRRHGWFAA